eukprot:TRINITY_DN13294_c0_g1_i1.p1 TRINITY_DN13294_c0_g1~~TRINITY_DN13294_c0_g1_i1.p1  ORF type:complete len:124 (-),score=1.05 TRINITY_DN13294_c0_g1_i1:32-403(-)
MNTTSLLSVIVLLTLLSLTASLRCYSGSSTSNEWPSSVPDIECGENNTVCYKSSSQSQDGTITIEGFCDIEQEEGCYELTVEELNPTVDCVCKTDLCNDGMIVSPKYIWLCVMVGIIFYGFSG